MAVRYAAFWQTTSLFLAIFCCAAWAVFYPRYYKNCPDENWRISDDTEFCYKVFQKNSQRTRYYDAEKRCRDFGAQLMSIQEAHVEVLKHYTDRPALWVKQRTSNQCELLNRNRRTTSVIPCTYRKGFICVFFTEPPNFCSGQANNTQITADFGSTVNISACIVWPETFFSEPKVLVYKISDGSVADGERSSISEKTTELYQVALAKMDEDSMRYSLFLKMENITEDQNGTWKVCVHSEKFQLCYNVSLEIIKPEALLCSRNLTVKGKTSHSVSLSWLPGQSSNGMEAFKIFYNVSAEGQMSSWNEITFDADTGYAASTVRNLSADTSFLFWVASENSASNDLEIEAHCDIAIVIARTDKAPRARPNQGSTTAKSFSSSLITVIAVSSVLIVIIVLGIFLYKKRNGLLSLKRKTTCLDETNIGPTVYFNLQGEKMQQ